jgi:nitrite reductase (NAD(P)H)
MCIKETSTTDGHSFSVFICGNGGANPRHATLFAKDVPPSKVVRILDRFLMYYIQTAVYSTQPSSSHVPLFPFFQDKLMRTARWLEQFDGGIERLKKILLDDELGICAQLEKDMEALVGTYQCEWTTVVNTPERRKQFRQFVNTVRTRIAVSFQTTS